MLRGNDGQKIFTCDEDRIRLCLMLQKASEEHNIRIHAYCFMGNHIHLVLEPTTVSLSKGVHAFAGRYAQYFNRRYKKRGHLFQDRFRSILVENDTYLARLVRYIHLNPVRAELVKMPQDYRWSSYKEYIGHEELVWLNQRRVLQISGLVDLEARHSIVEYTSQKHEAELDLAIVRESNQIGILGSDVFLEEMLKGSPKRIKECGMELKVFIGKVCEGFDIDFEALVSLSREKKLVDIRSIIALIVRNDESFQIAELARLIDRDSSTVTRLAQRAARSESLICQAERILDSVALTGKQEYKKVFCLS